MKTLKQSATSLAISAVTAASLLGSPAPSHAQSATVLGKILSFQGTEPEVSLLAPITQPLGQALSPLIFSLDRGLDPLTDPLDNMLLEPVLGGLQPLTGPLLMALEPVTDPVDGLLWDLTGGSLEDALSNDDDNTADGNGLVNDLLSGSPNPNSGSEAGEYSLLQPITGPLGMSLAPLVDFLDGFLDPLTDAIDDNLGEILLGGLAPLTEPLLGALAPVTDPVDGLLADLTGGSLEDALSNEDDNTDDGDGLVNDLLGGKENPDSGTEAGERSPLPFVTQPLGEGLAPLVDFLDGMLDAVTNPADELLLRELLAALSPLTTPLTSQLEPVTDPVDAAVADVTGGSLEDALSNEDDNSADGDGVVNDLLGGPAYPNSGDESGEVSALGGLGEELAAVLAPVIDALDTGLNPITDTLDDQLLEALLDALKPLVDPLMDNLQPVTDPVDGIVGQLTGGSVEDALTNDDDNSADGNGVVNDLLGGEPASNANITGSSPLGFLTGPLGAGLTPIVDALDLGLDPLTNTVDGVAEPLLGGLEILTTPLLGGLKPLTLPVDQIVFDLAGGSLTDGLTTRDQNTADGSGAVNDILGGGSNEGGEAFDGDTQPALMALAGPTMLDTGECSDGDGDGVCDAKDSCQDTPEGAAVLNNGCHLEIGSPLRLEGVFFETDSNVLTPDSLDVLASAVTVINSSTAKRLEIAGHTDSRASDEYNQILSEQRARTVANYLLSKGINPARLSTQGYGESQPVADNDSDQGMARNRRVELRVIEN